MLKKLSNQEAYDRTYRANHQLLEEYKGQSHKHAVECLDCKHRRKVRLGNLWRGLSRCPTCYPSANSGQALSAEQVNLRLQPHGIQLIGTYNGMRRPNVFRCLEHGHQWESKQFYALMKGMTGCPYCRLLQRGVSNFTVELYDHSPAPATSHTGDDLVRFAENLKRKRQKQ